jgi:hypothetical protein
VEIVGGVPTTQYRGTIHLDRVVSLLREDGKRDLARVMERLIRAESATTIPVEVWVDDKGLVRRMRQIQTMPTEPGSPTLRMDMVISFDDFGVEPDIRIPPAHKVFDATPLVQAELGLIGSRKRPPQKATATTHSSPSFRRRVGGLCTDMKADFARLEEKGEAVSDRAAEVAKWEGLASPRTKRAFQRMATTVLEPMIGAADHFLARLERLTPPVALKDEYERYLHLTAVQIDLIRALSRAFQVADYRLIDRLDARLDDKRLESELKRLAAKLGASVCEQDGDG